MCGICDSENKTTQSNNPLAFDFFATEREGEREGNREREGGGRERKREGGGGREGGREEGR